MARLTLSLLGPAQISLDGAPVQFKTKLAQALLVFLAMEADHPQSRETLATLLWPEQAGEAARHSLRQTLLYLRQAIQDATAGPFLAITRQAIQLDPSARYDLDVADFGVHLASARRHPHADLGTCAVCMGRLAEASALYRGDFLAQFFLENNQPFEEWALAQREALRSRMLEVLYQLADYHGGRGDQDAAIQYARRQVEIDALREEGYRQWMQAAALSRRRSEALNAYDTLQRLLDEELNVAPAAETTALYEQIVEGRLAAPGPTPPIRPRHNLPRALTPFVGREADIVAIGERLDDSRCALLTVFGPGGAGKTTLALEVARRRLDRYPDGVAFVELASLTTPDHLATAIGAAVEMKFSGKSEPQAELAVFLRDQQRLLILDNFEPLLPSPAATDLLLDLIQAAPGLQLLVTSREILNLRVEWLYELAGLPFPSAGPPSVEPARNNLPERFASVRLFTQHAHRLHRDFVVGPSEQTAINQLCRLVEGMPLAIELAAALTRTHTCAEIATAAARNLDSLTTAQHDVPARHHSLRALFDYSWSLLNGWARSALSRLAVFRAGLTAEAAGQVAEAGESDLNLLANKSFLRRRPDGRYEMHEVLRQYAAEKLAEVEAVETATRHADYFTRWVQRHEAALSGETMAESTGAIQAEIDNVRAAWRWAVEHSDLAAIARSMAGLARFYVLKSLTREGEAALRAAIHAVRARLAAGKPGPIAVALFDGPEQDQPAEAVLAALLVWHGRLLARSAQPEAAAAAWAESIQLAPDSQRAQAMAYVLWGSLDVARSDYPAARRKAEQALSLAQAAGWQKMEADANRLLGNIFSYQGDLPWSRQYYERCLKLERVAGHRRGTSATLSNLGSLCLEQGDTVAAEDYFEQALAIHRELGDQSSLAQTLVNLGQLWEVRGDYVRAQHCHAESLQITRLIGDRQHEPDALLHLGLVALGQDQLAAAQPQLDSALGLYRTAGDRWGEAAVLEAQGNLATAQGLPGPALEALQAALTLRRSIADHAGIASAQAELGRLSASQGHIAQAHAYLSAALETARTTRATVLLLRVMVAIAALLTRIGRPARALEVLACVLPHPSLESKTRVLANREWASSAGLVTEPALAAAQARGGQFQPEALALSLLVELAGYTDVSPA